MSINQVQFQKGLSIADFMERYGTQEKCHAALVTARWPTGFVCPHCAVSGWATQIDGSIAGKTAPFARIFLNHISSLTGFWPGSERGCRPAQT